MRTASSDQGRSSRRDGARRAIRRPWVFASALAALIPLVTSIPKAAFAGSLLDFDGDLVPDTFDNCRTVANGPNQVTNQSDSDGDGYGNRCDTDFDQSGTTTTADFARFLGSFGGAFCIAIYPPPPECGPDLDGSGTVTTADFGIFLGRFSAPPGAPGPSGLVCANPLIRIDLGDIPCAP